MADNQPTALVTGAAGFIGGHLSSELLASGWSVTGVDALTDFYDVSRKRSVFDRLSQQPGFTAVEADLVTCDASGLLPGVDVVFHLAGQPGVRGSWADGFGTYVKDNVLATQRLLEAARGVQLERFVFASSSSVYGNADEYPCTEQTLPRPLSPYGVTKLASEQLTTLYADSFELPTVSLRYFSVYGPRQRPDMAISRIIAAALGGKPFPMFGTGEQVRDFTYVHDVVAATVAAATTSVEPGSVFNVAGGSTVSLHGLIDMVATAIGSDVPVESNPAAAGDVRITAGDNRLARTTLGWRPKVALADGITAQVAAAREATPTVEQVG